MSIKGLGLYVEATRAGAIVQALDQAAKSDRQFREPVKGHPREIERLSNVGQWKLRSGPVWALGVIVLTIVIELVVFSD